MVYGFVSVRQHRLTPGWLGGWWVGGWVGWLAGMFVLTLSSLLLPFFSLSSPFFVFVFVFFFFFFFFSSSSSSSSSLLLLLYLILLLFFFSSSSFISHFSSGSSCASSVTSAAAALFNGDVCPCVWFHVCNPVSPPPSGFRTAGTRRPVTRSTAGPAPRSRSSSLRCLYS